MIEYIGKIAARLHVYADPRSGYMWYGTASSMDQDLPPQTIAVNSQDYRYTHGGEDYKRACELIWQFEQGGKE